MNNQQQISINNGSFGLIWYYWYKKYMVKKNKKAMVQQQLSQLKQKYCIQSISIQNQSNNNTATLIRKKIQQLKQKNCLALSLQSSTNCNSATSTNTTFTNPPHFYTINPQLQSKQIQQTITNLQNITQQTTSSQSQSQLSAYLQQQQSNELINQLHSYYLNCKCIFIIYKKQKDSILTSVSMTMTGELGRLGKGGNSYEGSLLNSKINLSSLGLNQDDSLGVDRNDSILDSFQRMEDKIQNLEVLGKFWEYDGIQIWNVKYYSIPHSFVNIKKNTWSKSLSQSLPHPSQPKPVSTLPILPRLSKHRPSIDKLHSFVSFMQQLWQKCPNLSPLCQSIFQYNGMPYIFVQDQKQQNIAVLCYYIVYGNQQGCLSQKFVDRWLECGNNQNSMLGKMIRYMQDVSKNRIRNNQAMDVGVKGLFDQSDIIW